MTDNAALAKSWYQDRLGRPACGDPGAQYRVDRLDVQAPADVLWAITRSVELNARSITCYYGIHLGCTPDAGARCWLDGTTAQRFPPEWVEQNIAASPGLVNAAQRRGTLVEQRYASVFGEESDRTPSRREVSYWNGRVRAVGALTVCRELCHAPEVVAERVQNWYGFLLGREA